MKNALVTKIAAAMANAKRTMHVANKLLTGLHGKHATPIHFLCLKN
jgi:hypothetical protein